jgi:hypothetical protein
LVWKSNDPLFRGKCWIHLIQQFIDMEADSRPLQMGNQRRGW